MSQFHLLILNFKIEIYLFFHNRLDDMSSSLHGDWPWHVALYKNGQHVCDGTLIDEQWIMTTSSCFQG